MHRIRIDPSKPFTLDASKRAGILTQAGVLAIHSHADQGSPVRRGTEALDLGETFQPTLELLKAALLVGDRLHGARPRQVSANTVLLAFEDCQSALEVARGARAYSYMQDTSAEGCWAKAEHKIQGIDVEGCRGAGCTPDAFK